MFTRTGIFERNYLREDMLDVMNPTGGICELTQRSWCILFVYDKVGSLSAIFWFVFFLVEIEIPDRGNMGGGTDASDLST